MSEDVKTTFGCVSIIVVFVALWYFLVPISDDWGISRVIFCVADFFMTSIITSAFSSLYEKYENHVLDGKRKKCNQIKALYPDAYQEFCVEKNIDTKYPLTMREADQILALSNGSWKGKQETIIERKKRIEYENNKANSIRNTYPKGYEEWKKKYKYTPSSSLIISSEEEIKDVELKIVTAQKYDEWEANQKTFAKELYDSSKEVLNHFGRYSYFIPFDKIDKAGKSTAGNFKVWQFFPHSVCLESDLDYARCRMVKGNTRYIDDFKKCQSQIAEINVQKICNFISLWALVEPVTVVLNDSIKEWEKEAFTFHYTPIIEGLKDFDVDIEWYSKIKKSKNDEFCRKQIIILDVFTQNDDLIKLCSNTIKNYGKGTILAYISMLKCYDRNEMIAIIKKHEEEDKARALALKEKLRKEKEAKEEIQNLPSKVSDWKLLQGVLHYNHLLYYYPTTCDFEASEEEWHDRRLVWDFKNTPGKTSEEDHESTLGVIIPQIKKKLQTSFGNSIRHLTLVCIPASTPEKTEARYKEFSEILCQETGMENAYSHLNVIRNSEEKKFGGSGITTKNVSFDKDFFKGKHIILFDDVITKGESMLRFKRKMESLDAEVICGFSVGRTKHERVDKPIVVLPPPVMHRIPRFNNNLPF